jgi:cytidylate kinase
VTGAVILGRAGGAAFRDEPGVLRVRLFGPEEARIAQAARIEDVDAGTARQRLPEVDRARAQYVQRLYGVGIDDPDLYHLQIDSTVVPVDACADLIAAAYRRCAR